MAARHPPAGAGTSGVYGAGSYLKVSTLSSPYLPPIQLQPFAATMGVLGGVTRSRPKQRDPSS
jgi:hypothetical protein